MSNKQRRQRAKRRQVKKSQQGSKPKHFFEGTKSRTFWRSR